MNIIIFLIVLAVLVLVHELGHFLAAKKSGIRVDEFGLGFPPRLWGKKIGETIYSINWIPFGGFVKIFGENPDDESIKGHDSKRSFVHKPRHIQAMVLIAGIAFNFIFAWLLICIAFMSGVPAAAEDYPEYASRMHNERVVITAVSPHSPAAEAGLKAGDTITRVYYENTSLEAPFESIEQIQTIIAGSQGQPLNIEYVRNETPDAATLTAKDGIVEGKVAIGIMMEKAATLRLPPHLALYEGSRFTIQMTKLIAVGLGTFIVDAFRGTADYSSVSGPVGIIGMVGDATRLGFNYLLMFTALISINLAIINLVPFPALDGGRLLFVLIEAISRKQIKPQVANALNSIGFVLLLLLMVFVTYKDIMKIIVR